MSKNKMIQLLDDSFDWSKDKHEGYIDAQGLRDRIIKHDVLHLLTIGPERERPIKLRFEDEYSNAIVQAVLEGKINVSKSPRARLCRRDMVGGDDVQVEGLKLKTIPQVIEFLKFTFIAIDKAIPKNFRENVTDEFVQKHINIANSFDNEFQKRYGESYISMDINKFVQIPFENLQMIFYHSEVMAKYKVGSKPGILQEV